MTKQQISAIRAQVRAAYKAAAAAAPGRRSNKPAPYTVIPASHDVVKLIQARMEAGDF